MKNASWKNLLRNALLAVTLCALPALAGPDNVGLGTGRDGALTVSVANTVVNVYAQVTAPLAPGDTAIVTGTPTGALSAGDLVMVLQTTGIVPEPPSGGPSPIDLANNPVGRWEFARLSSVAGTTLNLTAPLIYSYAANVTQVIRVPEYTTVTINPLRNLTARSWDGATGGILAFLATGTVTNNASPGLLVTGRGFRGGLPVDDTSGSTGCSGLDEPAAMGAQKGEGIAFTRYGAAHTGRGRVANGGGGGVCLLSGGGGGSNGGSGGQGGNTDLGTDGNRAVGGQGGAALSFSEVDHLMMGGGGGGGHVTGGSGAPGGAGGGIIFVRANALAGGSMAANGGTGGSTTAQDAASGGGGGGTIYLRFSGIATCGLLQAIGGTGGSANGGVEVGPGGGGGGGRILLQKGSGTCNPTGASVIGASAGVQQNSGAPGGSQYGATAGSGGSTSTIAGGFPVLPAPVVVAPANGSSTNDNTPTYSGTIATPLAAGTEIAIFVDGVEVGRVTPDAAGNWSFTPVAPLLDGTHTVNALAINISQGVQSTESNTNTFILDATPPAAPVVVTPANGSRTNDNTPTYTGTAEPGSTVTIIVDGATVGTVTADASGNWTFPQPVALTDGAHTVSATATDAAGNTSAQSDTNTFTVDTTPPAAPVVVTPANGSRSNNATPLYTGTAEANSTVTVFVDGTQVGTTTADGSGNWSLAQPTALGDGSHTVNATAMDAAGNTSAQSNTNTFIVDTTPPAAPVVVTPANGSRTNDNTPTYTGTAEANSTVTVFVDGTAVGTVTADGSGNWTFTQPVALADGSYSVNATAEDAAGNTSPVSNTNTFTVDTTPPAAPVVNTPADGSSTNDTTPAYTGTAEVGSTVTVVVDGTAVGTVTADASGTWSFTQPVALPEGSHTVSATATDAVGNTSPSSNSNTFTVDLTPPAAPVVSTPANGSITADNTPTYTGTAEAGSTVTVIVDGATVGTTTADASGNWTFTPVTGLTNGSHTVSATATDAAGNTSPSSNTNTFTVDATIPAAPVVTGPQNNTVTNDTTPTISGTAPPNSTVTVFIDGTAVGTTTADAAGNWTLTPTTPLADGPHDITATSSNPAGNTSPPSNTVRITVDTGVPDTTIVSGPSGDTESTSATFDFSSTESDVTYECSLDGGDFVPCADPAIFGDLAEGAHTLQVRARDSAGNVDPTPATASWNVIRPTTPSGDRDFLGDGIGCATSGGDPSWLAMMGLGLLAVLRVRRRRQ